jgi:DNA-binding NarL/FixJ family response regulator
MEATAINTIKTAIVEDVRDIREGLTTLINFTDGYECTGSYRSMEDAISRIRGNVPDVLLSDIGLPGMNGIEGIKILKEQYPQMTVLMLTVYDDDERIFDALCAGASGFGRRADVAGSRRARDKTFPRSSSARTR